MLKLSVENAIAVLSNWMGGIAATRLPLEMTATPSTWGWFVGVLSTKINFYQVKDLPMHIETWRLFLMYSMEFRI